MSLLCPERTRGAASLAGWAAALTGAVAAGAAHRAVAAEYYVQPTAAATAETNSNIDLDPFGSSRVEGYGADAAALIGVATPASETTIKPRLRYQDFPQETALNHLEGMFDFNNRISSQRGEFSLSGRYDHLNDYAAEAPSAQFNEVNPNAVTTTDAGRVVVGATRNYIGLQPQYKYALTPTVTAGASGIYQNESFSIANSPGHVGFNYYQGNGFISRKFGQRLELSVGGYASHYQAEDVTSRASAGGVNVNAEYEWSRTLEANLSFSYQHSTIDSALAPTFQGTSQNWGATGALTWQGPAHTVRLDLGRSITPGSGGGLYTNDHLHGEFERRVSERFTYDVAARAVATRGLWANVGYDDRNFIALESSVKWKLTRTWMVQGGYSYFWQKYSTDPTSANNNHIFVRIGYEGLPPQR